MPKKESDEVTSAKIARTGTIIVAVIALVGVLITAYLQSIKKADARDQSTEVEYVGRVLDADTLQPVAGAKITLSLEGAPPVVYTDSEGVYRFKGVPETSISGQVRVDAQGYQVYIRNITISPTAKIIEDIRLTLLR